LKEAAVKKLSKEMNLEENIKANDKAIVSSKENWDKDE